MRLPDDARPFITPVLSLVAMLAITVAAAPWAQRPVEAEDGSRNPAGQSGSTHVSSEPALNRPASEPSAELTVFAAVSTTDALTEIATLYERHHGLRVRLNFAASSTLARQIAAGAPADVFLSANPRWMDYLGEEELLDDESRRDLLGNRLVLIVPKAAPLPFSIDGEKPLGERLPGRLALGDPEHVPAGMYAAEALQSLGWEQSVRGKMLPCPNVRMALAAVELGEAAAGIVYATDAAMSRKVDLLGVFPEQTHSPIRYPVALVGSVSESAVRFLQYLGSTEAREVFDRHGFITLPEKATHYVHQP